eukprot:794786-Prymnesium_polylepis.3
MGVPLEITRRASAGHSHQPRRPTGRPLAVAGCLVHGQTHTLRCTYREQWRSAVTERRLCQRLVLLGDVHDRTCDTTVRRAAQ